MIAVDVAYAGLALSSLIVLCGLVGLVFLDCPKGKRFSVLVLIGSIVVFAFLVGQYSGSTYHPRQFDKEARSK